MTRRRTRQRLIISLVLLRVCCQTPAQGRALRSEAASPCLWVRPSRIRSVTHPNVCWWCCLLVVAGAGAGAGAGVCWWCCRWCSPVVLLVVLGPLLSPPGPQATDSGAAARRRSTPRPRSETAPSPETACSHSPPEPPAGGARPRRPRSPRRPAAAVGAATPTPGGPRWRRSRGWPTSGSSKPVWPARSGRTHSRRRSQPSPPRASGRPPTPTAAASRRTRSVAARAADMDCPRT